MVRLNNLINISPWNIFMFDDVWNKVVSTIDAYTQKSYWPPALGYIFQFLGWMRFKLFFSKNLHKECDNFRHQNNLRTDWGGWDFLHWWVLIDNETDLIAYSMVSLPPITLYWNLYVLIQIENVLFISLFLLFLSFSEKWTWKIKSENNGVISLNRLIWYLLYNKSKLKSSTNFDWFFKGKFQVKFINNLSS